MEVSRPGSDPGCDKDFGATVNAGLNLTGAVNFLGVGGKDGSYYSLNPLNGHIVWNANVVFGGPSGGFIGTSAYDGKHVVGSTGLGATSATLGFVSLAIRVTVQEPSVHAFKSLAGAVLWQRSGGAVFRADHCRRWMSFNGLALKKQVQIHDVLTGSLVAAVPLVNANWGGIAVVGNALVLGTGSTYVGAPAGVVVFTPNGVAPVVPTV